MVDNVGLKRHEAVLFVNIGWSEDYCRSVKEESRPVGSMEYLRSSAAEEYGASEDNLFVRRDDGYFYGGIGGGQVAATPGKLDVPFAARHPENSQYYIVGIFLGVTWEKIPDTHNRWQDCWTRHVLRLFPETRPAIRWPFGQGMRRWAKAGEYMPSGQLWPGLYNEYDQLCRRFGI